MKSLARATRKPGGGARAAPPRAVQRKAAQRPLQSDGHERQAEQRGARFARGEQGLGRGLVGAPAASFVLPGSVGEPLAAPLRESLEQAFDARFAAVRIHRDAAAQAAAQAMGARAFASGADVYFSRGAFDPSSPAGRELLAHELTHVLQQTGRTGSSGALEARALHASGVVQCDKPAAPAPISEDDQRKYFDELVNLHRGGSSPTGDAELEKAIERARTLLSGKIVNDQSKPVDSKGFNTAAESGEFNRYKSVRARSFILDCLKFLGYFKAAGSLLTDDKDFKLRTLGIVDAFVDFLYTDKEFGRAWLADWLTHDAFKKLWPDALLRGWRAFYLRPRYVPAIDAAIKQKLAANLAEIKDKVGKSPPQLRPESWWLVWRLIGDLDDDRIGEQNILRQQLTGGIQSVYEAVRDQLPVWRDEAAKAADDAARPAYERAIAAGKIPIIDESLAYWKQAFADYAAWLKKLEAIHDATLIGETALALPDGSLVAAAAAGLRAPFMQAAQALFNAKKDAEGNSVLPSPDEYQQALNALLTALTGVPFALKKKGEMLSWAGHVEAIAYAEASSGKTDPARLAQFAIFPLIVNDLVAKTGSYDAAADQAAPHFDDIRHAHRVRMARAMVGFARWLGWDEIIDAAQDTLMGVEGGVYTGKARLMLMSDWEAEERTPIVRMLDDFPGNRDKPILHDTPFTVRHIVEWFRYDYHKRLRESLDELLLAEDHLSKETVLDFSPLAHLRQTRKEVKASMAANAEAEYAIENPRGLAIKVPQRFSVAEYDVLVPKGAKLEWDDLLLTHEKTKKQLVRRVQGLIFPTEPAQGAFAWALPSLDGMMKLLAAIPSLAKLVAREADEKDADWLARLAPMRRDAEGNVSDEEKARVRLSDEDWKRLNEVLLRWIKQFGESEEKKIPDLWRRVIVLRRRWIAMLLAPRIEHFAAYPYVSHGPWGERAQAMKVRLDTPDLVVNTLRAFEPSARPMREIGAGKEGSSPEDRAEAERVEREAVQRAIDVQLVLLVLTLAPSLLKLSPSILDARMKTTLYEYYQLTIDFLEDQDKFKTLQAGLEVRDEAAAILLSAEQRAKIITGMKEFMTAIDEEVKKSQTEGGYRSEDGKSIRPNAEHLPHAIVASKKPGAKEEEAREWHQNQKLDAQGNLDETTGDTYRLVEVYHPFEFHRQVGSPPVRGLRKGAGGPYAPARVIITKDGETTEYTAPDLPDIDLFKFRINESEFIVKASDVPTLTDLDEVFLWRSFSIGMTELGEGLHTFADWMTTVVSLFVPEVAMAEFVVGMAQMLANGEFDDLIKQIKDDPLEFAQHALEELRDRLFSADKIWQYVLLGGQHSPWGTLTSFLPKRERKVKPPSSSKFGRVVAALRSLGGRFGQGLEHIREYTQPPLRRVQGQVAMHPTLVWLLHRAAHIVQAAFDLIPRDKLEEARKGDGPTYLVEFAQVLFGEQGALDKTLRERVVELFEGIQHFELPGELINLTVATELILSFILDRFGKRGKIVRMLLSVMPVPESWVDDKSQAKGFTNALTFIASRIKKVWEDTPLDPNKYWKEDLMPIIGTKFTEVRDDLVEGMYKSADSALGVLGMKALERPEKSALPATEVAPEPLLSEGEASAPRGLRGGQAALPRGGGTALPRSTRAPFERQLGADLSHVRVHANAATATQPIGADALTSGSHVFMRPGVAMTSPSGKQLLGHELTHVVQQTGARGGSPGARMPTLGRSGGGLRFDPAREAVADQVGSRIASGRGVSPSLRANIGRSHGLQPSLGEDIAMDVIATLSTVKSSDDFTKHLEGGRDPEGLADAKALAGQVFSALRTNTGVVSAAFMKDSSHDIPELVRGYLRELTDKFPEMELKRIAALAQTPHTKKAESDPDTELSPKSFLQLLANYLFAARHVAIRIEHDKAVKKVQKIELFDLNIGKMGGTAKLWGIAMENSFGGSTVVTDKAKAQAEMRERLNALDPMPKVWDSKKFRFAQWLIDDYTNYVKQRALGSVTDVPMAKEYANPGSGTAEGLAVSTHGTLKSRGVSTYDRESHHTTQYLLVEFFGNDKEASQKAFPGDPADFDGAGINFVSGSTEVNTIGGSGAAPLKLAELNKGSERGAAMPAVLLSARCHQRGELHVLRESRWDDDKAGDKERKGTATQGFAIENAFNAAIPIEDLRPRDDSPERRTKLRAAIKADPIKARTTYYQAALTTYKWMNDRMIPALKDGLLREEYAYYRGIAARNHLQADGVTLHPDWDLKPEQLIKVHTRADENNTSVMRSANWKV